MVEVVRRGGKRSDDVGESLHYGMGNGMVVQVDAVEVMESLTQSNLD
jgi:hypothetical protein